MREKLNVGVIGYGFHGETIHHAALQSRVNIVAVLEPNAARRDAAQSLSIMAYRDSDEFFRRPNFQAVIIASPVATHAQFVKAAVESGLAIELEKPMAVTYAESREIADIALRGNAPLMVGMTTHYRPEMRLADEIVDSGVLGKLKTIHEEIVIGLDREALMGYVAKENQGGVLLENGIHLIDHLLWYGGPIRRLLSATASSKFLGGYHEDVAVLHALHESGVESVSHLQWMPYREANGFVMKLYGTKGCLEIRGLDGVRVNRGGSTEYIRCYSGEGDYVERFAERHLPGVTKQLDDFAAFVLDRTTPLVTTEHVLESHRLLDEAYTLARSV